MSEKIRIALDCMGGDLGASVVLAGAELSLTQLSNVEFLAFGDLATLGPLIVKRPTLHRRTQIVHSEIAIRMDQKPAEALRLGRSKSSMALAIDAIKTENDRESATRRLFESGKSRFRGLDTESALELLAILNAAERLDHISPLKSVGLHPLKGNRRGQWAITVNGPWRICFRFKGGDAYEVEIVDYH